MEKSIRKIILIGILFLIAITLISTNAYAADKETTVVNVDGDYAVYIKGLESTDFKFVIKNNSTISDDLVFTSNWEDTNGIHIACLEKDSEIDKNADVYLIIKEGDGEEATISTTLLNLEDAISKEQMVVIESLTKIIDVSTQNTTTVTTQEDGVEKTDTVGQIDIIDSDQYEYQYQLIKIDGTESENAKTLNKLVHELQETYSGLSMFDKVETTKQIKDIYEKLKKEATWIDVENRLIYQPEESKNGDQYLVLLRQLSDGKVTKEDIQFLTCTDGHEEKFVKEVNVVEKATALPVTYDSIVLLIVLAVIVVIAILVALRIKKLKAMQDEK